MVNDHCFFDSDTNDCRFETICRTWQFGTIFFFYPFVSLCVSFASGVHHRCCNGTIVAQLMSKKKALVKEACWTISNITAGTPSQGNRIESPTPSPSQQHHSLFVVGEPLLILMTIHCSASSRAERLAERNVRHGNQTAKSFSRRQSQSVVDGVVAVVARRSRDQEGGVLGDQVTQTSAPSSNTQTHATDSKSLQMIVGRFAPQQCDDRRYSAADASVCRGGDRARRMPLLIVVVVVA
jgi:hypothetical protein